MLNRRILRLKAMQALYALEQAQRSNYQLALDFIHQAFEPDLNSMQIPTAEEVAHKRQLAKELFEANYQNETLKASSQNDEVDSVVSKAIQNYNQRVAKERSIRLDEMLYLAENIHRDYFRLLKLISLLAQRSEDDYYERKNRKYAKEIVFDTELNFANNKLVHHLNFHHELQQILDKPNMDWESEKIRAWFKILKKEDFYKKYVAKQHPSFEEDKEFMLTLVRDFVFQHEILDAYFDEHDIHWHENRAVLRNMVLKTLKNIEEDTLAVELYLLSRNWEDDREFFKELYTYTVKDSKKNEEIISNRLKNWDISRVAIMDVIILKMALSEMIHFPSIPVKVSINEYVELAKNYSTPKSKEFVNGILDTVSTQLLNEGLIRKSGRGLIDNQ